jgi:hypothetical protein
MPINMIKYRDPIAEPVTISINSGSYDLLHKHLKESEFVGSDAYIYAEDNGICISDGFGNEIHLVSFEP